MRAALLLVFLLVLPGAWFIATDEGLRWFAGGERPRPLRTLLSRLDPWMDRVDRQCRRLLGRRPPEPVPPVLITLELSRLEAEIRKVENGDPPHQAARLRAVLAAYDQVLLQLCERLDVPTDVGMPPLPSQDRLAIEAELVAAGHDW